MGCSRGWIRRLTAIVAILAVLVPAALIPPAANGVVAQQAVELYQSEQFDWYFFFDASTWSIEDQASAPGSEQLRLSDGEVFMNYWAFAAPDLTTPECLRQVLIDLAADSSILEMQALTEEGGPPQIREVNVADRQIDVAIADLVVTVDGPDGQFKLATREECHRSATTGFLLYRSTNVPAALYNELGGFYLWPEIASSYWIEEMPDWRAPVPVSDGSGTVAGTLAAYFYCNETFQVVARNTGGESTFVVEPDRFVAAYLADPYVGELAGQSIRPELQEWMYPAIPDDSSLVLRPGEVGLFLLTVPAIEFDLYYQTESGSFTLIGWNYGGCGAGGAAPVVIDID